MFIKFTDNTPKFEESIQILKRRYNTTASSTAVRWAIKDFAQNNFEADRLEEVIGYQKTRIEYLESLVETLLKRS